MMNMRTISAIGLGLAGVLLLAGGCDRSAQGGSAGGAAKAHDHSHDHDHDHGHKAPHGGVLIELGDHAASVEIVFDAAAGKLTLYTFDGCAENTARIKQDTVAVRVTPTGKNEARELKLAARENALTGEKPGDAAEFAATDDSLKGATALDGVIAKIEIKGQGYSDVKFRWEKSGG